MKAIFSPLVIGVLIAAAINQGIYFLAGGVFGEAFTIDPDGGRRSCPPSDSRLRPGSVHRVPGNRGRSDRGRHCSCDEESPVELVVPDTDRTRPEPHPYRPGRSRCVLHLHLAVTHAPRGGGGHHPLGCTGVARRENGRARSYRLGGQNHTFRRVCSTTQVFFSPCNSVITTPGLSTVVCSTPLTVRVT